VFAFLLAHVSATPSCAAYCAAIFTSGFAANCGTQPDFASVANCTAWCGSNTAGSILPIGADTDTSGDTLGCRIYHAGVAGNQSGYTAHCDHASIMGGAMCGTDRCDAYCINMMTGPCAGAYQSTAVCMAACATFPTNWTATFPTTATDITANNPSYWTDNVQCRMYHAAFPSLGAGSNPHCSHGWVTGGGACDFQNDVCTALCRFVLTVCTTASQRETGVTDVSSCVAKCSAAKGARSGLILGNAYTANASGYDTIDCRAYHATAAYSDPTQHCPHTWFYPPAGTPCAPAGSGTTAAGTSAGSAVILSAVLAFVAVLATLF